MVGSVVWDVGGWGMAISGDLLLEFEASADDIVGVIVDGYGNGVVVGDWFAVWVVV